MTIAIGFTSPSTLTKRWGGILLASDSRISEGFNITDRENKIVSIKFPNQHAIVAKAGFKSTADRFEEAFSNLAEKTEIVSPRTIADTAEAALKDVRKALLDGCGVDPGKHIDQHYSEFLLAYYFRERSFLYSINLRSCLAVPSKKSFLSIGNGTPLADFMLTSIDLEELGEESAVELAVGIVEMCKIHDSSCGGKVRIGVVLAERPDLKPIILSGVSSSKFASDDERETHRNILKRLSENFAQEPTP